MKNSIILVILSLCLFLCACRFVNTDSAAPSDNSAAAPSLSPLYYDSFDELNNAVKNKNKMISTFSKEGASEEQLQKAGLFIDKLSSEKNAVPYLNGKAVKLRDEEGFSNIAVFASEAYKLPCIFIFPASDGGNNYIKYTYLPDDVYENNKDASASQILKILSQGSANLNNPGDQHKSIYEKEIKLADRTVTALIYEFNTDKRNSTLFVYDGMLVEVKADPETWGAEWFAGLSFGGF